MPWNKQDATKHTKKASSDVSKRQWSAVANSALKRGLSEGDAVRMANGVVKKRYARKGMAKTTRSAKRR